MRVESVVESLEVTENVGHYRFCLRQRVNWVLETSEELLATYRPKREWIISKNVSMAHLVTGGVQQPAIIRECQRWEDELRRELRDTQMQSLGFAPKERVGISFAINTKLNITQITSEPGYEKEV